MSESEATRRARPEEMARAMKEKIDNDREVERQRRQEEEDRKRDKEIQEAPDAARDGGCPVPPGVDGGPGELPPGLREVARRFSREILELEDRIHQLELERDNLLRGAERHL